MGEERKPHLRSKATGRGGTAPHREGTQDHESRECWGPGSVLGRWQDLWGQVLGGIPWRVNPRHRAFEPWPRIWAPGIPGKGRGLALRGSNPFDKGVFIIGGARGSCTLCSVSDPKGEG